MKRTPILFILLFLIIVFVVSNAFAEFTIGNDSEPAPVLTDFDWDIDNNLPVAAPTIGNSSEPAPVLTDSDWDIGNDLPAAEPTIGNGSEPAPALTDSDWDIDDDLPVAEPTIGNGSEPAPTLTDSDWDIGNDLPVAEPTIGNGSEPAPALTDSDWDIDDDLPVAEPTIGNGSEPAPTLTDSDWDIGNNLPVAEPTIGNGSEPAPALTDSDWDIGNDLPVAEPTIGNGSEPDPALIDFDWDIGNDLPVAEPTIGDGGDSATDFSDLDFIDFPPAIEPTEKPCTHEKTREKYLNKYIIKNFNDTHHIVYYYYAEICKICKKEIRTYSIPEQELHIFDSTGVCKVCGYIDYTGQHNSATDNNQDQDDSITTEVHVSYDSQIVHTLPNALQQTSKDFADIDYGSSDVGTAACGLFALLNIVQYDQGTIFDRESVETIVSEMEGTTNKNGLIVAMAVEEIPVQFGEGKNTYYYHTTTGAQYTTGSSNSDIRNAVVDEACDWLSESGNYLILSTRNKNLRSASQNASNTAHFIAAVGLTSEGDFIIMDSTASYNQTYYYQQILSEDGKPTGYGILKKDQIVGWDEVAINFVTTDNHVTESHIHQYGVYYDDNLTPQQFCVICDPRTDEQKYKDAESLARYINKEKERLVLQNVMSLDDAASILLSSIKDKNEEWYVQVAAYAYKTATFQWDDVVKKAIPGSETVDKVREQAIQASIAMAIQKQNEDAFSQQEFDRTIIDSYLELAREMDDGFEFSEQFIDRFGNINYDLLRQFIKYDKINIQDISAPDWQEALDWASYTKQYTVNENLTVTAESTRTNSVKSGIILTAINYAIDSGIDIAKYINWNESQRTLFYRSIEQASENIELLTQLKNTYPDDKILVKYCNDTISEIEYVIKDGLFDEIDSFREDAPGILKILTEKAIDSGVEYGVPTAISVIFGVGGSAVTLTGGVGGLLTEWAFGTGSTVDNAEDIDILYTTIENAIATYNEIKDDPNLPEFVKQFEELNVLNLKLAGLEMAKKINKGVMNEQISSIEDSYMKYLESLATREKSISQTGHGKSVLRVRSGAGTSYSIVDNIMTGTSFTILGIYPCDDGTSGNWYKIKWNGIEGYVAALMVDIE